MKKIGSLIVVLLVVSLLLVGCGGNGNESNQGSQGEEEAAGMLGLGIVNSIAKSKDYAAAEGDKKEVLPVGQVDTVMAAVLFDADGKVVDVMIDTAQNKVQFDAELKVTNKDAEFKTKVELAEEYGMKAVSTIGKEWYEQIAELEKWMVGKSVSEIKGMNLTDGKPADAELSATVTVSVGDYIAAVEKAYNNGVAVTGAAKLGLGQTVAIAKSKDYAAAVDDKKEVLPTAQADTVIAATAFDAAGKVVGNVIDTAQIVVNFDAAGKVTSDKAAELKTKVEKGPAYGMKASSTIGKEWDEQIAELELWMIGKTVAEITGMSISEGKTTETDLTSSVTVTVTDYLTVVEESFTNAR